MKIASYSPKGGVGKSILASAMAYAFRAYKPHLIDIDSQQACRIFDWTNTGVQLTTCLPSKGAAIAQGEGERLCIFDCGQELVGAAAALSVCDALVVPVEADFFALSACVDFQDVVNQRYPSLDTRYVLTRYVPSRILAREVRDAARDLWDTNSFQRLCKTLLPASQEFGLCASNKKTVLQMSPDSNAGKKTQKLIGELADIWNLSL